MKFVLKYLKPYWGGILLSTLFIMLSTVCDLLLPTVMSRILDNGVYQADMGYIIRNCLIMFAIAVLGMGATLVGSKLSCDVVAGFCADVRGAVFTKVNQMSFSEFGRLGTAALVTRATHDVQTLSWVAAELTGTVFTIPVLFFGGFFLTMHKDMMIALLLLAFMPLIFTVVILIGKKILPLWDKSDKYIDKQNDIMRERLRGVRVIRAFNAEDKEHSRIENATRQMAEYIIQGNVAMGIVTPLATLLLNVAIVLVIYIGGIHLESGSGLTGGDVFAIIQYIGLVSGGVIMGAFTIITFPHAKVAAGRISQVLDANVMDEQTGEDGTVLTGEVSFQNVSFSYDGAAEPAVRNIDLTIHRGEKVAIIGGTGSGKSTLVSLLLGFRKPTSGQVLYDGVPMSEISIGSIREEISCCLQNASVYSDTIGENIRMGRLDATRDQIWHAVRIAQAEDFVREKEGGLDYVIKQSGKNLSGGQRQRINIARTLIKKAAIYIFDDSFSALDFLTEARLREALHKELSGKTQLVITQRVTSAMHCDRIVVMDKGSLVDQGKHSELIQRCDVYRQIFASQMGGQYDETK